MAKHRVIAHLVYLVQKVVSPALTGKTKLLLRLKPKSYNSVYLVQYLTLSSASQHTAKMQSKIDIPATYASPRCSHYIYIH